MLRKEKRIKKIMSFLLMITVFISGLTVPIFAGDDGTEDYVTSEGLKFTLDLKNGTAQFQGLNDSNYSGEVNVPSSISKDDTTFEVTEYYISYFSRSYPNVTALNLPNTMQKMKGTLGVFKGITTLTIPGSVEVFEASIQRATNLQTLEFENGVREIKEGSIVSGCNNLTTIILPNTLTLLSGNATFSDASGLTTITLPENLTLGNSHLGTFSGCTSLKSITIPASITNANGGVIPQSMFSDCTSLETVTVLGNVQEVANSAFLRCSNLTQLNLTANSKITKIKDYAFKEATLLNPEIDFSEVTSVGNSAFYNSGLSGDINLDKLVKLEDNTFRNAKITGVQFSDGLETIGKNVFANCEGLKGDVILPDTLTSIGEYAFFDTNINKLKIGNGLTSLAANVFGYCTSLKDIEIGSSIISISETAFSNCNNIESIIIHSSKDDVNIMGTIGNLSSNDVTFTEPSVGDVKDTISINNEITLQEAVNQADDNDTITISKYVRLTESVIIPEGKKLTIKAEDGEDGKPYIIQKDTTNFSGSSFFTIPETSSLTLENIQIKGTNVTISNGKGLIDCSGSLIINENTTIRDTQLKNTSSGVIYISGENATLTMNGGAIENNIIDVQDDPEYSGVVRVTSGANFIMNDGEIKDNRLIGLNGSNYNYTVGVMLYQKSSMTMKSGAISNNSGYRGSAVFLYGYDTTGDENASLFTMTGGTISNNTSKSYCAYNAAGAVYVEGNAKFDLQDGTLSNNKTTGNGGAITVTSNGNAHAYFDMSNGTITGNSAYSGGGIYVFSDNVNISGGNINKNTAQLGGGIYVEGNDTTYSTANLKKAIVKNNVATVLGGGMWACPTGNAELYINEGAAIYNNSSNGAGDDFAAVPIQGKTHSITLANRILGGGNLKWYNDGGLNDGIISDLGIPSEALRFDSANPGAALNIQNNKDGLALKAVVGDDAIKLAESQATLFIEENEAKYGGGIGSNGGVEIGISNQEKTISITKKWENVSSSDVLPEVSINILANGLIIDKVDLNSSNHWGATLDKLPSNLGKITITETNIKGYKMSYTVLDEDTNNIKIVITNKKINSNSQSGGSSDESDGANKVDKNNPDTKDNSNLILFFSLLIITGLVITTVSMKKYKLNNKQ